MTVWAFDLDGTLIGSVRSDRRRPGALDLLLELGALGVTCVLWSAGGAQYAERKAREHGIADRFEAFYDKAARGPDGRYAVGHFEPAHVPDVFVDDSPNDVSPDVYVVAVAQFFGGNDADTALLHVLDALEGHLAEAAG